MYDNKVRLSPDIIEKAEIIASEWGLKNARAAVEAVFRRYADDYRQRDSRAAMANPTFNVNQAPIADTPVCAALDELDNILSM